MLNELRDAWRDESPDHRLALVSLVAIGVALRLMYIAQPMRYDESVTYMYFVRLPWTEALSTYTYPNNHVFHTLLVKMAANGFGTAPWALRLPAFLAGVLVLPATYVVARAMYGSRAALIATAIVASSGILVMYSTNARGYSFVVLSFLLIVSLAIRLLAGASTRTWAAVVVLATLALWTIPVALYPLGAVALWYGASAAMEGKLRDLRRLAIAGLCTCALTLLLYAPIILRSGAGVLVENRFVTPSGWTQFVTELPRSLVDAMRSWSMGLHPVVALMLAVLAAFGLRRHRALSRFRLSLPAMALLWCVVLVVAMHRAPFPRVWLWMLPLAASLAGAGAEYLAARWPRARLLFERRVGVASVALSLGLAASVVTSFAVLLSRDTGTFRDADEATAALASMLKPGDRVIAGIPTNGPLEYYMDRRGLDHEHLTLEPGRARRVFVVVDEGEGQSLQALTAHSEMRDSTQFTAPVIAAELPISRVYLYERRSGASR